MFSWLINLTQMEQEFEIRDHRNKEWFWIDDEYLNGYARLLKPAATLVYLSLCRHANKEQKSWPSSELLCKELGLSNKTVIGAIFELERWRIINVSRSKNPNTKRQNPNVYVLTHKRVWKPKPSVETTYGAECNSGQEPSVNDDQKPSVPITLEVNTLAEGNTKKETQKPNQQQLKELFFSHPLFASLKAKYPDRDYEHQHALMCDWWLTHKKKLPVSITALENWLKNTRPDPEIEGERKRRDAAADTQRKLQEMSHIPKGDPARIEELKAKMAGIGKSM